MAKSEHTIAAAHEPIFWGGANFGLKEVDADRRKREVPYFCLTPKRNKLLKASSAFALALMVLVGVFSFNAAANDAETAIEAGEHYITMEPEELMLASFSDGQTWSLWNFLLSVASATLALMACIRALSSKKKDEYDEFFSDEYKKNSATGFALTLSISVIAAAGIIIFMLTQDMSLPMAMADWWTVAHAALFTGVTVIYIFAYRNGRSSKNETPARNAT